MSATTVIGTWPFSHVAVQEAADAIMENKYNILQCLEKGINAVEDDPVTGKFIVGRGGFPNAKGILEFDAAIMHGSDCKFGAVTCLQGVAKPISVAKLVLEQSRHNMLTGYGAQLFAKECGISVVENDDLQTQESKEAYQKFLVSSTCKNDFPALGHDTIGLLVKDVDGNVAAGTSTSGFPFKSCGRVGDSPLPGCGLYADNEAGAAAATGDGDNIMRFCPCFKVVELMKQGKSPKDACREVLKSIWKRLGKNNMFEMALIALNIQGDVGTASSVSSSLSADGQTTYPGFAYNSWRSVNKNVVSLRCEPAIGWQDIIEDSVL